METETKALNDRWVRLWRRLGVTENMRPDPAPLFTAYGAPLRHYHNLHHIADCLNLLDQHASAVADFDAAELAIWYHDIVYDPTRHDNEEQSAAWAQKAMTDAQLPEERINRVIAIVLATKHTSPVSGDAAVVVDIDLSILGRDEEQFDSYERAIRQEYRHVPEAAYRAGRLAVLKTFADRAVLFLTPIFHQQFERAARRNLTRSIAQLT